MQCFQKDPNLRVSARKLLKHPWISTCRRSDAPVSKKPANFSQAVEEVKQWNKALRSSETSMRVSAGAENNVHALHGQPVSRFNAAAVADPQRPGLAVSTKRRLSITKPKPNAEAFRSPEVADDDNWDNDFATAISPSALHLPHLKPQDNFGGMLSADKLKQFASIDETASRDNWDDNFDGELQPPRQFMDPDPQEQTIRPTPRRSSKSTESSSKAQQHGHRRSRSKQISISNISQPRTPTKLSFSNSRFELPVRPEAMYREQSTEDFSDLFPETDSLFTPKSSRTKKVSRHASLCTTLQPSLAIASHCRLSLGDLCAVETCTNDLHHQDSTQLMPPPELKSQQSAPNNLNLVQMPSPIGTDGSLQRQRVPSRPSASNDQPVRRTRSQIEIQKFAEGEDDEDFSDIFGPNDTLTEKEESDRGSEDGAGGIMLLSKLSNNSWLGDDEDEDDPFAMMDPEYNEMDLEANIARDIHARLAERVEELVQLLKVGTEIAGEERVSDVAAELLQLLYDNEDVKDLIVGAHGLLPILELLTLPPDTMISTTKGRQDMVLLLLRVVNRVSFTSFHLPNPERLLIVSDHLP